MTYRLKRRRDLLKQAAVVGSLGLSGCIASRKDELPSGRRVTDLSVTGLDSAPFSVTVTPTHSQITPDRTAKLALTVTVQHDGPVTLSFGNSIPFTAPQKSTPTGIWLLQGQDHERESKQTWIPANPIPMPQMEKAVAGLTAGDTLTKEWFVWGARDQDSYLQPGTYEFSTETAVEPTGEESGDEFEWTLSLTVVTESSNT